MAKLEDKKNNRIDFYDHLRIISMIAVIIMHVVGNTINTLCLGGTASIIYNMIDKLMYFAVPMFILISGAIFLNPNKKVSIKQLYQKYIARILICLFVFGILYSMMEFYYYENTLTIEMVWLSIQNIFTGNLWIHMWYLYVILGLYIILPFVKIFTDNCYKNTYRYILLILFTFTIFAVDLQYLFHINFEKNIFILNSPYLFFWMLGGYLSRYEVSKKLVHINYGISFLIIIGYSIAAFSHHLEFGIVRYTSITTLSLIFSLFFLVKNCHYKKNYKMIEFISKCIFGVYLLHQLIINLIYKVFKIDFILYHPYIGLPLYVIFIFISSLCITYLLRKFKFVEKHIL